MKTELDRDISEMDATGEVITYPKWVPLLRSQRNHTAESMGY
jgi:hypothetical protein